ncbi:MAG TPA: hypothetical protein PKA00_05830 [Saprospiraceae bacterium]|nr:hypothetical protein [Saprospiraceae bacterium]HMQ82402.1 hypothetical protein [Saprospiraceae bacterium]
MKKFTLCICTLLMIAQWGFAQKKMNHAGFIDINGGIGLFPTFVKDAGKMKVPPLTLNMSYRLKENFSVGVFVAHSVTETDMVLLKSGETAKWGNSFSVVGARMAAHVRQIDPWDVYGGLSVGYSVSHIDMMVGNIQKLKDEKGLKENSGNLLMTGFLGFRYAMAEKVGIFGEVGFGVSLATVGISVRLK